ncbi:MAG: TrbI/VirB10 family protein [Vitreimonas sp.]
MSEPLAANASAPNVEIRARPPSPKRLSRKVLLGGAALAGIVIIFSIVTGLSTPVPRGGAQSQSPNTATTPPESVSLASSQYDATDLTRHETAPPTDLSTQAQLTPPTDPTWSGAQSASDAQTAGARSNTPNPEEAAHTSPILFASASRQSQAASTNADEDAHLASMLTPPRSPFEIQAGAVIPAALVTGLNSDLPGRVIAQVTAPVYDSVTGGHLLIPQGARLIGTYDNGVHYGDQRIVLVWNRLILPNGWSINLHDMQGADPTGAAGIGDTTDNHLWRLGGAVGLSAIISVIANNSQSNDRSQSLSQSVGDAAAQQAAQTGSQIVGRELAVKPTLRVRPGANVRVLVMRDIDLRPYTDGDTRGGVGSP